MKSRHTPIRSLIFVEGGHHGKEESKPIHRRVEKTGSFPG